jgi:hypothetical protein
MLILLREGTKGLTSARKEFNALGGGVTTADAKKAEAYNDAMQKIQESLRSIKFAALTPIMEKLTTAFTKFSDKFKNAQWRTELIKKVTDTVVTLYRAFTTLGKGVVWATQNLPELITGIVLLKVCMFALNAAMIANPIGLIVAGIAALITVVTYLIVKAGGLSAVWNRFTNSIGGAWKSVKGFCSLIKVMLLPTFDSISTTFDRVKSGLMAGVGIIKAEISLIPRAILKALSMIPDKLLPDGWGDSIKSAQKQLEAMNSDIVKETKSKFEYAFTGIEPKAKKTTETQNSFGGYGMLRHSAMQSKSQVEVRIKSDKPVEIVNVQSDKNTEMVLEMGDLLGGGF